jgi:hypothetical protein
MFILETHHMHLIGYLICPCRFNTNGWMFDSQSFIHTFYELAAVNNIIVKFNRLIILN